MAKVTMQVLVDKAPDLGIDTIGNSIGLLIAPEILDNEDPVQTLTSQKVSVQPPVLGHHNEDAGILYWLSDSTCLLHHKDNRGSVIQVPREMIPTFESRELLKARTTGVGEHKFLSTYPKDRKVWTAKAGAWIDDLKKEFLAQTRLGRIETAIVVWNCNDLLVRTSRNSKKMKLRPEYVQSDGNADLQGAAFRALTAKAVEFASPVQECSMVCLFLVGGSADLWSADATFDVIVHFIVESILETGVPTISGAELYRKMTENGKSEERHFVPERTERLYPHGGPHFRIKASSAGCLYL